MFDKSVRAGAARRAAPWIVALVAAIMPVAASSQSQPSAQVGVGTAPAPKSVDLNAVPQASGHSTAPPRVVPRPRTNLTDQQYQALKDEAARRRFDMRNVRPLPPPANLPSGPTTGAP